MAIIQDIFRHMGGDGAEFYNFMRKSYSRDDMVAEGIAQYNADNHSVANPGLRPDKIIFVPTGEKNDDGSDKLTADTSTVSRSPIALQKYIINQKASFTYGDGVELKPNEEDSRLFDAVFDNWDDAKIDFILTDIARIMMAETQVAVVFFNRKDDDGGRISFRTKLWHPSNGDKLEPFFDDETGDMYAFGREYKSEKDTLYDLYVINQQGFVEIRRFKNGSPRTIEVDVPIVGIDGEVSYRADLVDDIIVTPYTKLPIIYGEQLTPECHDSRGLIRELEWAFNDFLTQMGYTGDPILFLKGMTMDLPAKGKQGKVIENPTGDGDAKFLESDSAHDARKLSFDMLMKFIGIVNRTVFMDSETLTQLSLESGEALERMLIDVYADAEDRQRGRWGLFVQRMINWLLHEHRVLMGGVEPELKIKAVFSQKTFRGESEKIALAMQANGGKPVVTHETSIAWAGKEDDVQRALEIINNEENGNNSNES